MSRASRSALPRHVALEHGEDVALDAEAAEDRGLLRQIADPEPAALEQRQVGDGVPVEEDPAPVGLHQPHDHGEDRGLAGAVRAEQPDGLAAPHREADVLDHGALAETLAEPVRDQPAGLVDDLAGPVLFGALVHCGVNTPVTRPPLLLLNTELSLARSMVSSGPRTVPCAPLTVTSSLRVRIMLRGS